MADPSLSRKPLIEKLAEMLLQLHQARLDVFRAETVEEMKGKLVRVRQLDANTTSYPAKVRKSNASDSFSIPDESRALSLNEERGNLTQKDFQTLKEIFLARLSFTWFRKNGLANLKPGELGSPTFEGRLKGAFRTVQELREKEQIKSLLERESDEELKRLQGELDKAKKELDDFNKMNDGDRIPLKARESELEGKVRELEQKIENRHSELRAQ